MSSSVPFDPWKTFHENAAEQAAIKERAKYRDAMKAEYRKRLTNPFRPPIGVLHDPALQRWYSSRVTYAEYIQPTQKVGLAFGAVFLFIGAFALGGMSFRKRVLKRIERGEISYEDRALHFLGK